MSWGDFFSFFAFSVRSPSFELLSYSDFGTFLVIPNIQVNMMKEKKIFFLNRHTMCTDRYECWQKKTPRLNFVVAFRCFTRNMKNFFCRRTLENCFFFSFFSYARAGSCQIILISFFLDKTLLCLMINCTCVPYRKVSWLNINTGFSSVLLFGSCISILSNGTNGRKRMRHSNSIESRVFYFGFFFQKRIVYILWNPISENSIYLEMNLPYRNGVNKLYYSWNPGAHH